MVNNNDSIENTNKYVRSFDPIEIAQIKELKDHYIWSNARTVEQWNLVRDEAKKIWDEKIISAVDALRKWLVKYENKTAVYIGVKF